MKLTDFGLWFKRWFSNKWSISIPDTDGFNIYYDGKAIGWQRLSLDYECSVYDSCFDSHIIQLKNKFPELGKYQDQQSYDIGRQLTLNDFDIIPNPEYRGDE